MLDKSKSVTFQWFGIGLIKDVMQLLVSFLKSKSNLAVDNRLNDGCFQRIPAFSLKARLQPC